eukprot:s209_g6.t1
MAAALGSGESSLSIETSSAKDVQQGSPYLDYEQLVLNSNKEGMDFLRKGQYKQAFEQLKYAEAVVVSKQGKDEATNLMSVTCNNLGCYYKKVGKLHAALSYLRKALKIEVSLQTDDVTVAGTHLNVCAILSKLDKHDKALQHALCALELIKHRVDSVESTTQDEYSVLAIAYHNVAVERDYLQQLQEAAAAYQQGHEVAKKCLGDQHPLTQTLAKNANAALQKSQAKAAQAEVERNRSPPAPREARPRKNSTPQVTTLPEISRAKEPSQDGLEEEVSRDQSFGSWNAPALGGDAGGFLPPLQPQPSSSPSVSQAYTAAEVAAPPSFIETMGPEARAAPPSPPPLIIEQRKDEESMVQEPEQRHGRPPRSPRSTDGAPTRPPRTRNRKPDPAVGHRETEAGLVPAAQQSQILRRSAAEKIQHFWRQYQRHKVQSCDQNRIENAAATKIQATFRAFAVRRSRRTKAATAIQRHLRGFLVRIALRRHQAAVVIQRHGIGFLTRKNLRSAVDAAVRIQRLARARIASINVEARRRLVKHAAKLVRGSIRTWLIREDLKQLRVLWAKQEAREESSLKIQSVWRGGCARQNVADMRSAHKKRIMLFRASARLQALARRHLAKKRVAKIRATQMRASHNAATTIRKMWLGHVYRRRYVALRKEFQEHEGSVVTLQRFARGYLVRLRMWRDAIRSEEQLWAAVEMQRCWRGYLGRLRWETEFERLWARESAAVMIQRNVRGWLARTAVTGRRRRRARAEFEKARRRFKAAQKIQALVRGVLCRKRVLRFWQRKVEAATTIQRIWRGHKLRCQKFEKDRTRDAVRIQSAARRFLVRNRRFQLLAKVIMISRQWRHWRHFIPEDWALRGCRCTAERERRRARSKLYREAATTIQRYVEAKNYAAGTEPQTSAIESAEP